MSERTPDTHGASAGDAHGAGGFAALEALFHELASQSPASREARLAALHAEDPALEAAVRALLASHDAPVSLNAIAADAARALVASAGAAGATALPIATPPLPERIGKCRILRRIGEGGMGTVYEAEQENPKRRVAVKVLRTDAVALDADSDLWRRFAIEARALGTLRHPGIAHIHEAGTYDSPLGPRPYLVMEFIDGPTLPVALAAQRLSLRERLTIHLAITEAVAYAHDHGVIHRDLKPSNILMDADGRPRILDFGLARLTDGQADGATFRTDHGQIMGTVAYMSPEQLTGRTTEIDARTDVYALGVILYELLAGRLPHDLRGVPLPEAARIVQDEEPSRLGSFDRALRGDLETIAAKAMAKERRMRYASAAAMAADLRRHLDDQPIIARPPSPLYQWGKFARRNRGLVAGLALAFATLVIATIALARLASGERQQRSLADARATEAIAGRYRAALLGAQTAVSTGDTALAARSLDEAPAELRGWEYRHLRWLAEPAIASLDLRATPVAIAIDPTGPRAALLIEAFHRAGAASGEPPTRSVVLVGVHPVGADASGAAGAEGLALLGEAIPLDPTIEPSDLRFAPDGRSVAAVGYRGTALIDVTERRIRWTSPRLMHDPIQPFVRTSQGPSADAAPRFALAVIGADPKEIELLDCAEGSLLRRVPVGSSFSHLLALDEPDTVVCWLNIGGYSGCVDLLRGVERWRVAATPLRLERNGEVLVHDEVEGVLLDPATGIPTVRERLPLRRDGRMAFTADRTRSLEVDARDRAILATTGAASGGSLLGSFPACVAGLVEGRTIEPKDGAGRSDRAEPAPGGVLCGTRDGMLRLYLVPAHPPITGTSPTANDASAAGSGSFVVLPAIRPSNIAAVAPDGSFVLTLRWGLLHCHETLTGRVRWSRTVSRHDRVDLAIDARGTRVAITDAFGTLLILSTDDGAILARSTLAPARGVRWLSRDALAILLDDADRTVLRLSTDDAASAAAAAQRGAPMATGIDAMEVAPDGRIALARGGEVLLDDRPVTRFDGSVAELAFDATSERLAILTAEGELLLCDARSRTGDAVGDALITRRQIAGFREAARVAGPDVRALRRRPLAFAPDGQRLAVSDLRGDVHIVDVSRNAVNGGELLVLRAAAFPVQAIGFSADGERLIAAGSGHAFVAFECRVTPAVALERPRVAEAAARLRTLFAGERTREEVQAILDADRAALPPEATAERAALDRAVAQLAAYSDDVNQLNSLAWAAVRYPGGEPPRVERALRFAKAAEAVFPDDHGILNTRATAELRLGRFRECLETLDRCDALALGRRGDRHPIDLIVRAMALASIGDLDGAQAAYDAANASPESSADLELQALLREAATLVRDAARQQSPHEASNTAKSAAST